MDRLRLVPVARGLSEFEARVVTARLGSEGIVWQLRGADAVYPFGNVDVLVPAGELDEARCVLLPGGDDTPDVDPRGVVDEPSTARSPALSRRRRWLLVAALAATGAFVLLRTLGDIVADGSSPHRCAATSELSVTGDPVPCVP